MRRDTGIQRPSDRTAVQPIASHGGPQAACRGVQSGPADHRADSLSGAGNQARAYRNYKALLENKDVGVVIIATPEHWHHRMLLDALAAGKDVYVEKPLCHTPEEGAELVEAARQSKSIVQVGMQRR